MRNRIGTKKLCLIESLVNTYGDIYDTTFNDKKSGIPASYNYRSKKSKKNVKGGK